MRLKLPISPFSFPESLFHFTVTWLLILSMQAVTPSWWIGYMCLSLFFLFPRDIFTHYSGQANLEQKSSYVWKTHLANWFHYATGWLRIVTLVIATWILLIKALPIIFNSVFSFSLPFCFVLIVLNLLLLLLESSIFSGWCCEWVDSIMSLLSIITYHLKCLQTVSTMQLLPNRPVLRVWRNVWY